MSVPPEEVDFEKAITRSAENRNFLVAEYDALREESQRCAQILSNTVWIAVTGFGLTIAAFASLLDKTPEISKGELALIVILFLCVQSVVITVIYLSELWKYIRVGYFIREMIEPNFNVTAIPISPVHWEQWVKNHRAHWLYLVSTSFLQLPIFLALILGSIALTLSRTPAIGQRPELFSLSEEAFFNNSLSIIIVVIFIIVIFVLDIGLLVLLSLRVRNASKGKFSRKDASSSKKSS